MASGMGESVNGCRKENARDGATPAGHVIIAMALVITGKTAVLTFPRNQQQAQSVYNRGKYRCHASRYHDYPRSGRDYQLDTVVWQ